MTQPALDEASHLRSVSEAPQSLAARKQIGKAARRQLPLGDLGAWDSQQRQQDAVQTVLVQNAIRVPALFPIRAERMAASPWSYYRGAAAVMAADLAATAHSGLSVQLCGDAHVLNFGLWATPERGLSFDLRDFDETIRGPFEWDVKRLVCSLVVLARANGLGSGRTERAVRATLRAYRDRMSRYATAKELDIWYDRITADDLISRIFVPADREQASAWLARQAHRRTHVGAARKLTHRVDGRLQITTDPPFRVSVSDADYGADRQSAVRDIVQAYHDSLPYERRRLLDRFTVVDVVRQIVGVGSVGMRVYLVLLEGRSGDDPLFLQIKQAGPSVYEQFLDPSPYPNHGQRVISGKRAIQFATDIFVGWTRVGHLDFYVRQFRDMKVIPRDDSISPYLEEFGAQCGAVLARAHARTGDAAEIAGYIGKGRRVEDGLTSFAFGYAEQNQADHRQFAEAIGNGEMAAALGGL
jgi:uncharacterized protein (DUF2252 family)